MTPQEILDRFYKDPKHSWREHDGDPSGHGALSDFVDWLAENVEALAVEALSREDRPFIVAEVTKNWPSKDHEDILAARFEGVVALNRRRGYRLHSWRYSQSVNKGYMSETIIAVFEKEQ